MHSDNSMLKLFDGINSAKADISLSGLCPSSKAYIVSETYKKFYKNILVIVSDMKQARSLVEDIGFFSGRDQVHVFPNLSGSRNDFFSSELPQISRRMKILDQLETPSIVVAPIIGLLQKTLHNDVLKSFCFDIEKNKSYCREDLTGRLISTGYVSTPVVENVGEFTFRGSLLDIFTPCEDYPARVEFFGDDVESIRFFDPVTQVTIKKRVPKKIRVVPVREVIFSNENIDRGKKNFKFFGDKNLIVKTERDKFLLDIENKIYFSGIDHFLPFFEENLVSPINYFSENTVVFVDDSFSIEDRFKKYFDDKKKIFFEALSEKKFAVEYNMANSTIDSIYNMISQKVLFDNLEVNTHNDHIKFEVKNNIDILSDMKTARYRTGTMLAPLVKKIKIWEESSFKINFVARTRSMGERLSKMLEEYNLSFQVVREKEYNEKLNHKIYIASLNSGFRFYTNNLVFVTDEEIFGERRHIKYTSTKSSDAFLSSFSELRKNDYLVHVDHGVGKYIGLTRMGSGGAECDFLAIEYKGSDKLYLPVYRLNTIQKYSGGGTPLLDKLGSVKWKNTKKKVKESIFLMANDLLKIYAARKENKGFRFNPPDSIYREFEATFPFEETNDQLSSINDVISDLISDKITDRLICGDVGYGKTEVAIRASLLAVLSGKQVAVLVPTTLLAEQHYRTFLSRLEGFPVNVEMISRFRSRKEIQKSLVELESGYLNIVIGTHRLLSNDVKFSDLGLLIIDEEQRFGVKHKEKLKNFKSLVDVITLSATPIPRTLQLSFLGVRDVSIINTPPVDRLAIRTYVVEYSEKIIQEAVLREIKRGGQIFFIHNRVQTINTQAEKLREILPGVRIGVAHGQLPERMLEQIMLDFVAKKFDLIVTSTIIENGIDISSANTIIINRADKFGLSQLYQLRGRVGRSSERAYCYLIIPDARSITPDARKRLQVIKNYSALGAGFKIASHDLELRGGGNILGKEQSGHIEEVGFDLYLKLLEETIHEIKGEKIINRPDPEINLNIPAYIPDSYINNMSLKLVTYKRISSAKSEEELDNLEIELCDRFGKLPAEVINLLWIVAIKINLSSLNVTMIKVGNKKLSISFDKNDANVSPEKLISLMTNNPNKYSISPDFKLIINLKTEDPKIIMHEIRKLLDNL